jgi:ABC-type lipoprotein export system ATPase subunit
MLKIRDIKKSYENGEARVDVLKGVNLEVGEKEFAAIQGPSGAGKSTLLHIAGALDKPTSGNVSCAGVDIYSLGEDERSRLRNRQIGFVFQFYHLLPELSALENVMLPAMLRSWRLRGEALSRAKELLDTVGLSSRMAHKPSELSGGEQQRVAVARALINKPRFLFCDEPTGNLDSANGANIISLIRRLNKEEAVTVLLVTHYAQIASCADRVIYLKDGLIN